MARIRKHLGLAIRVIATAAIFAVLIGMVDVRSVSRELLSADPVLIGLALSVMALAYLVQGARLYTIARADGHRVDPLTAQRIVLIGNAVNQVLPAMVGGDAARVVLLHRRSVPLDNAVRQVGLDRFSGLCGLILTMAMTAPFISGAVFERMPAGVTWLLVAFFALALAGGVGVSLLLSRRRSGPPSRFITPLLNFGAQLWHGLERLMQAPGAGVLVVALSIANQITLATTFWIVAASVDVHIDLAFALFIIPIVSVVMLVPVSISGWGVREAALVTALGFVNVPATQAVAASVLFGLASVVYALISAPLFLQSSVRTAPSAAS